jgi:hypothetical protein
MPMYARTKCYRPKHVAEAEDYEVSELGKSFTSQEACTDVLTSVAKFRWFVCSKGF